MSEKDMVQAIVQKVYLNGKHGSYSIATSEGLGSVTFSLESDVWNEEDVPEPGEIVMLSKLRKKREGWRAMCGRRYRPSDQQPARSK